MFNHANRVRNLLWRLGLRHCLAKDSFGFSGGVALFWDESVDVSLLSQGDRCFDVLIKKNPLIKFLGGVHLFMESLVLRIDIFLGSSS